MRNPEQTRLEFLTLGVEHHFSDIHNYDRLDRIASGCSEENTCFLAKNGVRRKTKTEVEGGALKTLREK